jgi:hypothetical protein
VLGEHKAVDADLFRANPLTVVFDLGAAVIGLDGMRVKVEDQSDKPAKKKGRNVP